MSKAFLRESDAEDVPELSRTAIVLPSGVKNLMTAAGAEMLRTELDRLVREERPSVAARVEAGAEARSELLALDQRIRQLQGSLHSAEIVAPGAAPFDFVRFGSQVRVREADGSESRYRIVGVAETALFADAVSWQSPLARALLNARRGERIAFQAPGGLRTLEVVTIE